MKEEEQPHAWQLAPDGQATVVGSAFLGEEAAGGGEFGTDGVERVPSYGSKQIVGKRGGRGPNQCEVCAIYSHPNRKANSSATSQSPR